MQYKFICLEVKWSYTVQVFDCRCHRNIYFRNIHLTIWAYCVGFILFVQYRVSPKNWLLSGFRTFILYPIPDALRVSAGWALLPVHMGNLAVSIWLANRQLLPLSITAKKCSVKKKKMSFFKNEFTFWTPIVLISLSQIVRSTLQTFCGSY